ncbi:homoserine dehydrogenase [Acaryochloris marina]|uniref:Homoserine dehydrogenase n=1 Tax=Acaryochloris marina (strain MBIC 11017) TaxID=329726 RepID=B0BYR0_ACAM1|nr:homoserine dehydrogenase [Acaryochloris marina]ABW27076.1 homoserine dehydrogenase [Acaryochloris marina MBIC11017]BDM81840.1 homoserine dehydrogenase [Acaryochloris marina MBIC10699]
MGFKIGLLGLGTVGTGVGEIFANPKGRHPLLQELEIAKVGVRSLEKARSLNLPTEVLTTDLNAIVNDPTIDMVVEVIGGLEPARSLILEAIAQGKHVVTANKAVIARFGEEIFQAATQAGVYVMIEAAVAGGIPVIQPLKESLGANRIHTLIGILNGTTNYILTKMQQSGAAFDDVLAEAQELGYAEADPTADVDGLDAGDKIAILASLAFGGRIDLEQVHREGIRQVSAADINYAKNLGFVIKLLAIAKVPPTTAELPPPQLEARVHPTLVPVDHPLANVNDVYNALLIEANPLGQVMFFGPGAGAGPTASAVVADLINIAALLKTGIVANDPESSRIHPLLACSHQHYCNIAPMNDLVTRFYARFLTKDHPGVIGKLGTVFGNHGVSLESVVQTGIKAELAEIVVVTHDVQEGNFHQALDEIRQMEAISSIPSLLRVL